MHTDVYLHQYEDGSWYAESRGILIYPRTLRKLCAHLRAQGYKRIVTNKRPPPPFATLRPYAIYRKEIK